MDIVKVGDRLSLHVGYESFENTDLGFGDYIRLKGLQVGDVFHLETRDGNIRRTIVIGNGTPFEGISQTSHDGWDWQLYNSFRVLSRASLHTDGGEYLTPVEVKVAKTG